jgi:hypothetical protein
MRGLPVFLLLLTVLVAACDEDGGTVDATSEPDGSTDPVIDADAASEPASEPAADPGTEPAVDTATETATDPATETTTDPGTDGTNAGCVVRDTPGCGGCACESCVCEIEPHCCTLFWDEPCVWDCEHICGEEC